jgi:hypothetical protein
MSAPLELVIADVVARKVDRRIRMDRTLERYEFHGPNGGWCVYAAPSYDHAARHHASRMRAIVAERREQDEADPPPPHLDCPYCPMCASRTGTTDRDDVSSSRDAVACAACGHSWVSREDRDQAARADAAYARRCEDEAQRERDAARLGPELWAANERLLAEAEARSTAPSPEQLAWFGASP